MHSVSIEVESIRLVDFEAISSDAGRFPIRLELDRSRFNRSKILISKRGPSEVKTHPIVDVNDSTEMLKPESPLLDCPCEQLVFSFYCHDQELVLVGYLLLMAVEVNALLFYTIDIAEFDHFVIFPLVETPLYHYFGCFEVNYEVPCEEHFAVDKL